MKVISSLNSEEVVLIISKDDLAPYYDKEHDTARSRFADFARALNTVAFDYYTDARRTRTDELIKPYIDLIKSIKEDAEHLSSSEFKLNLLKGL